MGEWVEMWGALGQCGGAARSPPPKTVLQCAAASGGRRSSSRHQHQQAKHSTGAARGAAQQPRANHATRTTDPSRHDAAGGLVRQVNIALKLFAKIRPSALLVVMSVVAGFVLVGRLLPLLNMQTALGA